MALSVFDLKGIFKAVLSTLIARVAAHDGEEDRDVTGIWREIKELREKLREVKVKNRKLEEELGAARAAASCSAPAPSHPTTAQRRMYADVVSGDGSSASKREGTLVSRRRKTKQKRRRIVKSPIREDSTSVKEMEVDGDGVNVYNDNLDFFRPEILGQRKELEDSLAISGLDAGARELYQEWTRRLLECVEERELFDPETEEHARLTQEIEGLTLMRKGLMEDRPKGGSSGTVAWAEDSQERIGETRPISPPPKDPVQGQGGETGLSPIEGLAAGIGGGGRGFPPPPWTWTRGRRWYTQWSIGVRCSKGPRSSEGPQRTDTEEQTDLGMVRHAEPLEAEKERRVMPRGSPPTTLGEEELEDAPPLTPHGTDPSSYSPEEGEREVGTPCTSAETSVPEVPVEVAPPDGADATLLREAPAERAEVGSPEEWPKA
ncbi:hypothetical protein EAI_07085 [Harpegnathos saltator]|uniref:Uncharacterized protein n=1 Tax=Harpegnathos saltator TaxID=610380 RepID=E2B912_HARSA|nr:hypothetical protein EAI_07085 [Harpegnathos saltator]